MMDSGFSQPAFEILPPAGPPTALVIASPHSGVEYPSAFVEASRLDRLNLRKSEDSFVDELFAAAPSKGAPLLRALFSRAYVDTNREPYELDPAMFADPLPDFVNIESPRVAAGLGTIARVVSDGESIYHRKLTFAEADARIKKIYMPYHAALEGLVSRAVSDFGHCMLIDAHSMPSTVVKSESSRRSIDIVLGDRVGNSCHPAIVRLVERIFKQRGYAVVRNTPYAGGYTTLHYGKPHLGRHCLQIEINRALYMDEVRFVRKSGFTTLHDDLTALTDELIKLLPEILVHQ